MGAMKLVGDITTTPGYTDPDGFWVHGSVNKWANIAGHAVVGCASAEAGGGSCRAGALSAGFGAAYSNFGGYNKDFTVSVIRHAAVGGIGAVLAGGQFGSGAFTAALGYVFNECAHTKMCGMGQGGYSARDSFEIPSSVDLLKNEAWAENEIGSLGVLGRLIAFKDMVDYGAPWDFKILGVQYENFGNYHYGWMGAAAGISEDTLLRAAGFVQCSNSGWFGEKTSLAGVLLGYGGTRYFGDDPKDAYWIKLGIETYRARQAGKGGGG
jgi:hypothetical protein